MEVEGWWEGVVEDGRRWKRGEMEGRQRGKGKEVGGTQGRGTYVRRQRGGDVREEGKLHRRSVALPSYKFKNPHKNTRGNLQNTKRTLPLL